MSYILLNKETARALLPRREETAPKWAFGRTALVCGCAAMSGAALLAGLAALRSGAGLVQLCSVPEVIAAARTALPEALSLPLDRTEGGQGVIRRESAGTVLAQGEKAQSLLVGCGLGISCDGRALLDRLLEGYSGTVVIDADGLNLLAERGALPPRVRGRCILTPHAGEFRRLSGPAEACEDPGAAAEALAARYGAVVALKGAETHITDGLRRYVLSAPNSGMAKGGSGDVLAGLTAGLAAQMPDKPLEAAALAVWLHARAGQLARQVRGARAMLPRDVLECLGAAFSELED